jgi:hypothetical protein
MKLLLRAAQQTGVRRVLHQHVLEAIDNIRWRFYDSTRVGVHIENPGLPIRPFDNLIAHLRVFRCLLRVISGVGRDPIATAAIREPAGIDHRDW